MDFEVWTHRTVDRDRRRRLLTAGVLGAVGILSTIGALAMTVKTTEAPPEEENVLEVQLAKEPEPEPEPETEPDPEPAPSEPQPSAPRPAGPILPQLTTPTEIPDDAPTEKDVSPSDNPYAAGDPYMYGVGQAGTGPRSAPVVKAEAPKAITPPPSAGPSRVTADTTPPQQLSAPPSVYPPEAKAAGVEGTVIVKLIVDEGGNPTNVRAVKGPEPLRAACEERFKQSKYSPAIRDGKPVAVQQVKKCVFKLNT